MTNKVFYHLDIDGECAAAAIYNLIDPNAEFISVNHNKPFPIDRIENGDIIWILDFSTEVDMMDKIIDIVGIDNIIWIDHHRSAIEKFNEYDKEILGVRSTSKSGCELTWTYIIDSQGGSAEAQTFSESEICVIASLPQFVEYIGKYDTWRWIKENSSIQKEIRYFISGLESVDTSPKADIWTNLLDSVYIKEIMFEIGARGVIVEDFKKYDNKSRIDRYAFKAKINGHDCVVVNNTPGAEVFGELCDKYPVTSVFMWDGDKFNISLYSQIVDVGRIAEAMNSRFHMGGGGHPGAAGFNAPELPFTDIVLFSAS